MRSTRAMEPPPAPISISSTTGTRMGSPEPFLNRSARATSNSRASSGSPRSMTQALAVVPPMSKDSTRSMPDLAGHARRRERPRRGPRFDEPDRHALGGLRGRDAARRHHDVEPARDAESLELALEVVQVARHQRHHVHVGGGGGGALVLADLGHHVGGAGHRHARARARRRAGRAPARAPGSGRRAAGRSRWPPRPGRRARPPRRAPAPRRAAGGRSRRPARARTTSSAELARHERHRRVDEEVVHVVAAFPADLDRVPESGGREQPHPRALALDQRVGGQRGAVDQRAHRGGGGARLVQQGHHAFLHRLRRVLRRGQELADADGAGGLVHPDQVGEGAADVHADPRRVGAGRHVADLMWGIAARGSLHRNGPPYRISCSSMRASWGSRRSRRGICSRAAARSPRARCARASPEVGDGIRRVDRERPLEGGPRGLRAAVGEERPTEGVQGGDGVRLDTQRLLELGDRLSGVAVLDEGDRQVDAGVDVPRILARGGSGAWPRPPGAGPSGSGAARRCRGTPTGRAAARSPAPGAPGPRLQSPRRPRLMPRLWWQMAQPGSTSMA